MSEPIANPTLKEGQNALAVLLLVDNLPHGLRDDDFKNLFQPFGRIVIARLVRDRQGLFLGFGFVQLEVDDPTPVVSDLDGKEIGGQRITVRVLKGGLPGAE